MGRVGVELATGRRIALAQPMTTGTHVLLQDGRLRIVVVN
jgi:hypothetical protein